MRLHQDKARFESLLEARRRVALLVSAVVLVWAATGSSGASAAALPAVDAGFSHSFALTSDATIVCWGSNSAGQSTPPAGRFSSVSAGLHSCAVRSDAIVLCWGLDDYGQARPPAGSYSSVSAGKAHSCAVKGDAAIVCWGHNGFGQAAPPVGTFTTPDGKPIEGNQTTGCEHRDQIAVGTLTVTAAHWHTRAGLKIGDRLARLQDLYPRASEHPDGWWLHTIRYPWGDDEPQGDLVATVRDGIVTALTVSLAAGGD